jgi:hypothetical protein
MDTSSREQPTKRVLRKNYEYLVNELNVSTYLDALYAEDVISFENKENLQKEESKVEQARAFLDILLYKPDDNVRKFFEILGTRKDKQHYIYKQLFPSVTAAKHQDFDRAPPQDGLSRTGSLASGISCQEEPSKPTEKRVSSRPDLERPLLPTQCLDHVRPGHHVAEDYRKLQQRSLRESEPANMLLPDILSSKGENSAAVFSVSLTEQGEQTHCACHVHST